MSSATQWAYQIVFDQDSLPDAYWDPQPETWEITHARTEYDNDFDGLLGRLLPDRECLAIVVVHNGERPIIDGPRGEDRD